MNKDEQYKKDKVTREVKDLDKEISFDVADAGKKSEKAVEERNARMASAFARNPTFLHFMINFMRAFWLWGEKNQIEFWEVGYDPSKSGMSINGKHISFEASYTNKNPNPVTGERKTDSGLILPGK